MYSAENGNLLMVRKLKSLEGRFQTDFGSTALMYAAMAVQLECARELAELEKKMVNSTDETALVYAAYYGHHQIAQLLIEEAGIYNTYNDFALCYAIERNWP